MSSDAILDEGLEELAEALGDEVFESHEPVEIDGASPTATLRPADGPSLGAALVALGRSGLAALVRGGGTRLALGNPPLRADVILSTERLAGVDVLDAEEGICHAGAGTPLSDLRARARAVGWDLPLDAPGAGATLGGVIAAAATGPRAHVFGRPRDVVLGLEVALPSGDRIRSGGRVVKNVTGYDLNKVFTGSLGTLGVIEGAWLRLRPLPERTLALEAAPPTLEEACQVGLAAARRHTARAVGVVAGVESRGDPAPRLVVELAGDVPSVERDAAELRAEGARPAPEDAVESLRALQGSDDGLRFRLSVTASKLGVLVAALGGVDAELLVYPGLGLVYARFDTGADARAAADAAWSCVASAATRAGAGFRLESAPASAKAGRDVFGQTGSPQALVEALKARFDPQRILNPGRFLGRV